MIPNNLKLVKNSWNNLTNSVNVNAEMARNEMMTSLIQLSKNQIQGRRKEGEKATAGQPPKNRTGNLRRSIIGKKYTSGFGTYNAIVGPTMVYARAVELGGEYAPRSWHGTSAMKGFPYMEPAYRKFQQVVAPQIVAKYFTRGL